MNPAQQVYQHKGDEITSWVKRSCETELTRLCERYPSEKSLFVIDWTELFTFDSDLARDAKERPADIREAFKNCVIDAVPQQALIDGKKEGPNGDMQVVRGRKLQIAFADVGETHDVTDLIKGDRVGELVTLRGKCTKATDTRPKLTTAALRCKNCGEITDILQPTHGSETPNMCSICETNGVDWEPELSESDWVQHQLVRIKHEPGESDSDSHIDVHLTGDYAGTLTGGESVDITGVLEDIWPDGLDSGSPEYILDADTVRKHDNDFESIDVASMSDRIEELAAGSDGDPYQLLVDSIAPGIYGGEMMDRIKLSLALQLFGGKRVEKQDGTAFRGDIHQLLVGAPGTGKSSLLDAIHEYSPRTARVSGKNATKAGVTAAAVRDDFGDTEWSIEAGAFVQANKGVCMIDELDKVEGDVLSSLHSALERQELSIAKAGINADLQCRTSLLGACNPENERFIDEYAVVEQIPVGTAMRSRLDSVFVMRDNVDTETDKEKVESMLHSIASGENVTTENFDDEQEISPELSKEEIQAWVAYAQQHHDVTFDVERLTDRIQEYYKDIREKSKGSGAPVNIRKVGSILRYAVASARVRLADTVTNDDIDRAISVVSASLAQIGLTDNGEWSMDAEVATKVTQASRKERIKNALDSSGEMTPAEVAANIEGVAEQTAEKELEELATKGLVIRPETGVYRLT